MAVNFGTFEGHRILTDSTNKNIDRLVNAVREKKRQEEEAERLKLQQDRLGLEEDRFQQTKLNQDRTFESDEIAKFETSTGYKGVASYDEQGNFVGVKKATDEQNNPIPTFARTSYEEDMKYKNLALEKEYGFKDKQLTQQGQQFDQNLEFEQQKLFETIQQTIADRVQRGEMFDAEMTFKDLQLNEQQNQFLLDYGLRDAKLSDYLKDSALNRELTKNQIESSDIDLNEKKKDSLIEGNVSAAKTLLTSENLGTLGSSKDTEINSMLEAAGFNPLSSEGMKIFRKDIEDEKTRQLTAMEQEFKQTGKIDMDAYSNLYFQKHNEVPDDLKDQLIRKTGGEKATLLKYGMDDSDKLWGQTTTTASKGNWTKKEEIGADGQNFQFKGKNITDKDDLLVGAMRNKIETMTSLNDSLDDMFLEKVGDNRYVLSEDDAGLSGMNDELKVRMGSNGPQVLLGGKYIDLDETGLELAAEYFNY
jgi:hypothetical protein